MKKYKLIKWYPGIPEELTNSTLIVSDLGIKYGTEDSKFLFERNVVENSPGFWELITPSVTGSIITSVERISDNVPFKVGDNVKVISNKMGAAINYLQNRVGVIKEIEINNGDLRNYPNAPLIGSIYFYIIINEENKDGGWVPIADAELQQEQEKVLFYSEEFLPVYKDQSVWVYNLSSNRYERVISDVALKMVSSYERYLVFKNHENLLEFIYKDK